MSLGGSGDTPENPLAIGKPGRATSFDGATVKPERRRSALPPRILPEAPDRSRRAGEERGASKLDTWATGVYILSRLALLAVALAVSVIGHVTLHSELANWDGAWYLDLVRHGYPDHTVHGQSTLGFLPLYPMVIWLVARVTSASPLVAGLLISAIGGLVGTVLVARLAREWWGETAAMRAAVLFAFFPGTVVFSMVYSECLTVPLVAGCLLALRRRQWVLAGILAGLAGAVEPVALAVVPVCIYVSVKEILRSDQPGWTRWRSAIAPLLSPAGLGAFAIFLWVWTGTPFATLESQYGGWHQHADPLTVIVEALSHIARGFAGPSTVGGVNLNFLNGLVGAGFLIAAWAALRRCSPRPPGTAFIWTAGIGVLTLLSVLAPPNARMLLVAFPAVIVWARLLPARAYAAWLNVSLCLFAVASALTFYGHLMRP